MRIARIIAAAFVITSTGVAQDPNSSAPSPQEKWQFFVDDTFTPLNLGAAFFNASLSQITLTQPRYGAGWGPYAQRYGAAAADIATQNFFDDYLMASLLH